MGEPTSCRHIEVVKRGACNGTMQISLSGPEPKPAARCESRICIQESYRQSRVSVTTCGLHFELIRRRSADNVETRRLVWDVQALGFTAELCMPVNLQTAKQATRASTSLRLGCCLRLSSLHPYCFTMAQLRLAARAQYCCSGHNMWFRSKPQVP